MALFPITGRFVGDFVPHLVAVDTEDTMDEIAGKVAANLIARLPGSRGAPGSRARRCCSAANCCRGRPRWPR
jgi:hypothetical protein